MAYRWFCRLDMTDRVPDHSTSSKNRHGRFRDSDLFRHVFERVVARCITEGLVGGQTFATDARPTHDSDGMKPDLRQNTTRASMRSIAQ